MSDLVSSSQPFSIEIEYEITEPVRDFRVGFYLYTSREELLFISFDRDELKHHQRYSVRKPGYYLSRCHIPPNLLNGGSFVIGISASVPNTCRFFWDPHAVSLTVDVTGGVATQWKETRGGYYRPALEWEIECQRSLP